MIHEEPLDDYTPRRIVSDVQRDLKIRDLEHMLCRYWEFAPIDIVDATLDISHYMFPVYCRRAFSDAIEDCVYQEILNHLRLEECNVRIVPLSTRTDDTLKVYIKTDWGSLYKISAVFATSSIEISKYVLIEDDYKKIFHRIFCKNITNQ